MSFTPFLPREVRVAASRFLLTELLKQDPMLKPEDIEDDGHSVQMEDEWGANDYDYENNGFKGAHRAAELVSLAEDHRPALLVGQEFVLKHRDDLKKLAT